jgi:hypothetical protein
LGSAWGESYARGDNVSSQGSEGEQQPATATLCSQDYWVTHVLDARPERYQPGAPTLLCAMPDAERRLTSESLRDLLTGGSHQLALWGGERPSQDWAGLVTCDYPCSKHSCHWPTSGIIKSHDVAVRLRITATQDVQPLAHATTTFWEVLSGALCSTAVAWATCKSYRRPSYRSKHCSEVRSSRYIRSTDVNPLSLRRGGPLGPRRSVGGRP